jgi:hypothetical protein
MSLLMRSIGERVGGTRFPRCSAGLAVCELVVLLSITSVTFSVESIARFAAIHAKFRIEVQVAFNFEPNSLP